MISAMHSGSGKTTITYGLIHLLLRKGFQVQSFKTGPDYIDPMYHKLVSGRDCFNLDPYFLEPIKYNKDLRNLYYQECYRKKGYIDIAITESAMGYFDGIYGEKRRASASIVAEEINASVILVVDTLLSQKILDYIYQYEGDYLYGRKYQNRIQYIIVNGCTLEEYQKFALEFPKLLKKFQKSLRGTHTSFLKDNIITEESLQNIGNNNEIRVLGFLPKDQRFLLESRHLGLFTPNDKEKFLKKADMIADAIEQNIEYKEILREKDIGKKSISPLSVKKNFKTSLKIAIARDNAFCFFYKDNFHLLHDYGIKIVFFSPLRDTKIPEGISGLWIPGGYPEIYAKELSQNRELCELIYKAIQNGLPTIAECGGFLYLHKSLEGIDGKSYSMCNYFDFHSYRMDTLQRFGYIEVESQCNGLLLEKGEKMRSHEFHYWESENPGEDAISIKANFSKSWHCVHMNATLYAGFPYIYFRSNLGMLDRLKKAMQIYSNNKGI